MNARLILCGLLAAIAGAVLLLAPWTYLVVLLLGAAVGGGGVFVAFRTVEQRNRPAQGDSAEPIEAPGTWCFDQLCTDPAHHHGGAR